ncbi:unnamed protein product [Caenorhabditis auriculariae]|uniref:Tyrosine-protein kinase n=1 Tax=Caenorhabditis auriculariae TaxID=2777116 RepID=A0A8S1HSR5_9PELO|nr:unnamed protein product [Caenorhabditis auriculariae]
MEDAMKDKKTMEGCNAVSVEEAKGGATCGKKSSVWGIQQTRNAFVSVFGGVVRLKSGSEVVPTVPCAPTSPNQPTGSIQKPKEEAPTGYEVEGGGEAALSATFQKMEEKKVDADKLLSELTIAESTRKGGPMDGVPTSAEQRKKTFARRNRDEIHDIIVPEREVVVVKVDDESFLVHLQFYHGFLPQMETRIFIRRSGDFLLRKWEDEGQDFLVVSVGVLLDYTKDGSEELEENYGQDEPVRVKDYIVERNEVGLFIDEQITFDSLENLLAYYVFHPNKASLKIQLKRPCPRRVFQFCEDQITKVERTIGISDVTVAVKSLLKDSPNLRELSEKMLDEARIMLTLSHEHVIEIYGWVIDKQPFKLVLELMEGGSLDCFLMQNFDGSNNSRLLKLALDAAKGIAHLHEMEVLHRDVAARNCLLTSDLTLKVSDFGLATSGRFYFMTTAEKLPTRYLSPETLSMYVFVQATDSFAFGNLLYEIFSGGMMPFEDLSSAEAREKILTGEMNDLEQTRASPALRSFVEQKLWTYQMRDRTDMDETVEFLKVLYRDCKKIEGGPKTITEGTLENKDAEAFKKNVSIKIRRRKPVSRTELMEDICPTQEETVVNND